MTPFDRSRRLAADLMVVIVAAGLTLGGTRILTHGGPSVGPGGWLLLAAGVGALWFRRRSPVTVLAVTIGAALTYVALDGPGAFYTVSIVVAVHAVAAAGRRWAAVAGVATALIAFVTLDMAFDIAHEFADGGVLWFGGWLTVGLLAGEVVRARTEYVAATEERARQAEQSRQEEQLRRAGEERMRIARELHDVLAHSISIINVQAGAAAHHLDTDPEKSREALATVRDTGKQALRELRSSLGVLRDGVADPAAPRRPSPDIGDIDRLVATTRETGLDVMVHQDGDLAAVPSDAGLAIYRVIQESLTNVTRHAEAGTATVRIERLPGAVRVLVEDDGRGVAPGTAHGHGLTGMAERVRALGGDLMAGPGDRGGFRVEAHIPVGGDT